jgi:hypothetical protein
MLQANFAPSMLPTFEVVVIAIKVKKSHGKSRMMKDDTV